MNKRMRLTLIVCLAVVLVLSACSPETGSVATTTTSKSSSSSTTSSTTSGSATSSSSGNESVYPIVDEPITLTWFKGLDGNQTGAGITDLNQTLYMQEISKITGINFEFTHPALGEETTQRNLMFSSGEVTDIINYNFNGYPGGPRKAISDGIAIDYSELADQYAPNYKKVVASHPGSEKYFTTDDGLLYGFVNLISLSPEGTVRVPPEDREIFEEPVIGLVLRADWLKDLGLEAPTTIDEWYNVLTAFKNEKNAIAPFTAQLGFMQSPGAFYTAYGVANTYFSDDGSTVKYGPYLPEYKEFLKTMHKWYDEGLIDSDIFTHTAATVDSRVLNNESGAWAGYSGGGVGAYMQTARKDNPDFDLVGVPVPTRNKTDKAKGFLSQPFNAAMPCFSATNPYPVETMKLIDFFYTDEGDFLINWGVEGTSCEVVDGAYKFTDLLRNDPSGIIVQQAMQKYIWWGMGDFATRFALYDAYGDYEGKVVVDSKMTWGKVQNIVLPPLTMPEEDSKQYSAIMADINTYVSESFADFVTNGISDSGFDEYIATLESMDVEEAIQMNQAALERYKQR